MLEVKCSLRFVMQFPALYQQGPKNLFFKWRRILGWMANGVYSSLIAFFFVVGAFEMQAFRQDGKLASMEELGGAMYTCIVWVVNVQIALSISYFTIIQHAFIWGSILLWYLFLLFYGLINPLTSTTAYKILTEALSGSSLFWLMAVLVPVACVLPYMVYQAYLRMFAPQDHHLIQEIHHQEKHLRDPEMYRQEKLKSRQKTKIGLSARVEATMSMRRTPESGFYDQPHGTADDHVQLSNMHEMESPLFDLQPWS
jgi:phospholipid-translocating ATPase